jgi:ABC-type glycerol-3-phosphate transport system substrate-binding protein
MKSESNRFDSSRRSVLRALGTVGVGAAGTALLSACAGLNRRRCDGPCEPTPTAFIPITPTPVEGPRPIIRQPGLVTFWTWASGPTQQWLTDVHDLFAARTGNTLQPVFLGSQREVENRLASATAAGAGGPDAVHVPMGSLPNWAESGLVRDLTTYLGWPRTVNLQQFVKGVLPYASVNESVYGIPYDDPQAIGLALNAKHLEEAGISVDAEAFKQWGWENLQEAAGKLTQRDGDRVTRAGMHVSSNWIHVLTWLYSNNTGFFQGNADGGSVVVNNAETQAALQFLADLVTKDNVSGDPSPFVDTASLFVRGRTSMAVVDADAINHAVRVHTAAQSTTPELQFHWLPLPKGPSGSAGATQIWSNQIAIPEVASNPTSGWDLLAFLYTRETLQDYLGSTGMTLPFKPQWKYPMAKLVTNFTPSYTEYLDLLDQESPSPVLGRQALGRNLATPLRQAISGQRPVAEMMPVIEQAVRNAVS